MKKILGFLGLLSLFSLQAADMGQDPELAALLARIRHIQCILYPTPVVSKPPVVHINTMTNCSGTANRDSSAKLADSPDASPSNKQASSKSKETYTKVQNPRHGRVIRKTNGSLAHAPALRAGYRPIRSLSHSLFELPLQASPARVDARRTPEYSSDDELPDLEGEAEQRALEESLKQKA